MKKLWLYSLSLTLLLAIGCGKDEEGGGDDNSSDTADAGDASGGGNPYGDPNGGGQANGPGAPGGGDPNMGDGEDSAGPGSGDGNPYGGQNPDGGVAAQPKQPSFDPSLPAGKRRVWTYGTGGMDIRLYVNKTAEVIAKAFGQPKSYNKLANNNVVYTYDKMRVRAANKEYSTMLVTIQPLPKGGTRVTNITLDPKSAKEVAAASGPGLNGGYPGGQPGGQGQPGGFEGEEEGISP